MVEFDCLCGGLENLYSAQEELSYHVVVLIWHPRRGSYVALLLLLYLEKELNSLFEGNPSHELRLESRSDDEK